MLCVKHSVCLSPLTPCCSTGCVVQLSEKRPNGKMFLLRDTSFLLHTCELSPCCVRFTVEFPYRCISLYAGFELPGNVVVSMPTCIFVISLLCQCVRIKVKCRVLLTVLICLSDGSESYSTEKRDPSDATTDYETLIVLTFGQ